MKDDIDSTADGERFNRLRDKLFGIMRDKADAGEDSAMSFFHTRYSMVICAAGHSLTGEGDPPIECPICRSLETG